jgi:drug/metabolite transporter (DMT)-like permease
MPSNQTRAFYPGLSVALGAILWGVIWYPMRLLEQGGLVGIWLTLILYATAWVVSLPYTYRAFPQLLLSPGWLAVLMLSAGWTNIAFVEAVLDGNILRVLLLFYLSPLWATLLGWLLLGERLSRLGMVSLAVATFGAAVMLSDPATGIPWPQSRADWFGLTAGFAFAVSNVATRRLQEIAVSTKVFCVWSGVTLMAIPLLGVFGGPLPDISTPVFAGAMALGLGILVMTLLIQYGVTHLPVYRSAVITFIELVAGAVSQQLLTDEVVTMREWAGGALIVLGAYLAAHATSGEPHTG